MVQECLDQSFQLMAVGPVPGIWAKTYALLSSLQLGVEATICCDNSTVVHCFRKALNLLHLATWRNAPDKDLWLQILNWLVAAGPSRFRVQKVKAHRVVSAASSALDAWTIVSNARFGNPCILHPSLCSRKGGVLPNLKFLPQRGRLLPRRMLLWPLFYEVARIPSVPSQYDVHWLMLVQHYFSLLTWCPANNPGQPVALLELLFDLLCTFQIPMPRDLIKHKEVPFPGITVPKIRKYFPQFPASQGDSLPLSLLKQLFVSSFDLVFCPMMLLPQH